MVVFLDGDFFGGKDKLSGKAESSPSDLEATVLSGLPLSGSHSSCSRFLPHSLSVHNIIPACLHIRDDKGTLYT